MLALGLEVWIGWLWRVIVYLSKRFGLWPIVGKQQRVVHILHTVRHSRQACFCAVFDKHKPADSAAHARTHMHAHTGMHIHTHTHTLSHTHTHTHTRVLQADHKLSHQCGYFVPVMIRWAQRRVTPTLPQSTRSWKDFSPQTWTKTCYSAWIFNFTGFFILF